MTSLHTKLHFSGVCEKDRFLSDEKTMTHHISFHCLACQTALAELTSNKAATSEQISVCQNDAL